MASRTRSELSIISVILQLSVGAMLFIGGIWALMNGGDEAAKAVATILKNNIFVVVFGVIELIAGLFLILKVFIGDRLGSFGTILMIIIAVCWAIGVFCADIIGFSTGSAASILSSLYRLARDLIILSSILICR